MRALEEWLSICNTKQKSVQWRMIPRGEPSRSASDLVGKVIHTSFNRLLLKPLPRRKFRSKYWNINIGLSCPALAFGPFRTPFP